MVRLDFIAYLTFLYIVTFFRTSVARFWCSNRISKVDVEIEVGSDREINSALRMV